MAERPVPEAIARLDLASIADVGTRQAIRALLSLVEELVAENQALRTELAQAVDELAHWVKWTKVLDEENARLAENGSLSKG